MDLRASLNAISDVIVNRPPPLRVFDQIYMKAADMLIQAEHVSKYLSGREVVFIGDGDALALSLVHLGEQKHLPVDGPVRVHVLDFDERVVNSVTRFAERLGYEEKISASLYNVFDPLPPAHQGKYGAFYTNPPYGGSNEGASVKAFLIRGIQALRDGGICCAALADDQTLPWCNEVLHQSQSFLLGHGCYIAEMVPEMHSYHLDDNPDLKSCSLIARLDARLPAERTDPNTTLPDSWRKNFYGRGAELQWHYVRDLTNGQKLESFDYKLVPFIEAT